MAQNIRIDTAAGTSSSDATPNVHDRQGRSGDGARLLRQEKRLHLQKVCKLEAIAKVAASRAGGVFLSNEGLRNMLRQRIGAERDVDSVVGQLQRQQTKDVGPSEEAAQHVPEVAAHDAAQGLPSSGSRRIHLLPNRDAEI
jgi:hypothetical protein